MSVQDTQPKLAEGRWYCPHDSELCHHDCVSSRDFACYRWKREWLLARHEQTAERKSEAVNHPEHYGGNTTYEVIKVLRAWGLFKDALLFNVVKYVARAGKKGDLVEDLEKAKWYLEERIKDAKEEARAGATIRGARVDVDERPAPDGAPNQGGDAGG